jgi:alpha-L-rhamnosidase
MLKRISLRTAFWRISLMIAALSGSVAAGQPLTPVELRCEYRVNPLGIDIMKPRLSWRLEARDTDARSLEQTAYRILAAASPDLLDSDTGGLWDSGKISGAESLHHSYAGADLASGRRVYWKVRVWNGADQPGPWSKTAYWSMGLLQAEDWGASWIGDPDEKPADTTDRDPITPPSPLLRRAFEPAGKIERALLSVTARGLYECRLNGERIGDHQLAPEWTDYKKRIPYQTFDVTAMMSEGENVLGAMLADGWYLGRMGPIRWDKDYPRRGVYGPHRRLLLRLDVTYENGTTDAVVSDETWKVNGDGPIRSADLFIGEVYDARKNPAGWDMPGFDDSGWKNAVTEELDDTALVAQMNEPIRVVADLPASAVTEPTPGVYIFDIGQNIAGWCRLRVNEPAGREIVIRHGEMLNPDGTLYTKNLGMAIQTDRYISAGGGEAVCEPRFTYHGFRYAEVTGLSAKPDPAILTGRAVASDAPVTREFSCSNPMLNKLVENAIWTQRGNMHSVPTDCPQRDERMGWMGDAQVFAQSAIYHMDMAAFFTKWIQDIRDAQAEDGSFPDIAPHPYGPDDRFKNAPGWADAGVVVPWRLYQNYADTRILEEHIAAIKRYIDGIQRDNPDLIWRNNRGNNYGDWLNGDTIKAKGYPQKGGELDKDNFATAFFAYSTRLTARICAILGMEKDAEHYAALARDIEEAYRKQFVRDDGRIKGDTQAGYAMALHFDLLPEGLGEKAAGYMAEAIHKYDDRISTGFHSTYRMMLELNRWGYEDLAYKLVESTRFPSWGYSIEQGATTIWERWDGYVKGRGFQNPGMNSFNHYAIGAVVEWIYRNVTGINPDDEYPGWKHFILKPQPGGTLTDAQCTYQSIRGEIHCGWEAGPESFRMDLRIPPNTTAAVHVPAKDAAAVLENGKPAAEAAGLTFTGMRSGTAVFNAGSGSYRFTAPWPNP